MRYVLHLGRQLLRVLWKKTSRKALRIVMFAAPAEKRIAAERWLRGREQFAKLGAADVVVVSFGKSGRTWLRVMLSRIYQLKHGLSERALIGFDNLHYRNRQIPRIFFTHDNYIKDYTGHSDSKVDFYDKKVVLLVRDPRDVAVSQFFQWKFRMRPEKKSLNQYPEEGQDVSMLDFVMDGDAGLARIISFMDLWASEAERIRAFTVVRYEDLKARPEQTLGDLLEFVGTPAAEEQIRDAIRFASYENMKKMEQRKVFRFSGGRLVPRDRANPNSYKVRRGKVGGYRDYFDDRQVAAIDALLDSTLSPHFGYGKSARTSGPPAMGQAQASGTGA
jgi:hypothetical protein